MLRVFCSLSLYFLVANCAFPSYINKCQRNDPNFNQCLKIQANILIPHVVNGDPNFGIPSIHPVPLPRILLIPSKEFRVELLNCMGYGLNQYEILDIKMNFNPQTLLFKGDIKTPIWECNYVAKGKISNKDFDETGNIKISFINSIVYYSAQYETIQRNNISYYYVLNDVLSFTSDNITYVLSKKNNTNTQVKKLSTYINEENSNFQKEFIPSARIIVSTLLTQLINLIFAAIPVDELFLP